jgi:hypothetical protein
MTDAPKMTQEHIEATSQGAQALHKVAEDRGHNYGQGTNHEMRTAFYAASQRLRDHAARLAEVEAFLRSHVDD